MAKCLVRYEDPAKREATRLCGRPISHKGNHASVGQDDSWVLWTPAGDLVMGVGFGPRAPSFPEAGEAEEEER